MKLQARVGPEPLSAIDTTQVMCVQILTEKMNKS
jgi:hypothetical protein